MSRATQNAWAASRVSSTPIDMDILANPDVLDKLILWRMSDPRYADRDNNVRSIPMQRQWTIEARADFADKEKNDAIDKAFTIAAAHVNAVMQLLSDGQKPQVVCFSDDFFAGHVDIDWLGDPLGRAVAANAQTTGETTEVSDEMLAAVRDLRGDT